MSKAQQAPPDSWDMDPSDTTDKSVTPGLSAMSLNVNAPAFVPNVNAPAFVPSNQVSAAPPTVQTSAAPGSGNAPTNSTTSTI